MENIWLGYIINNVGKKWAPELVVISVILLEKRDIGCFIKIMLEGLKGK